MTVEPLFVSVFRAEGLSVGGGKHGGSAQSREYQSRNDVEQENNGIGMGHLLVVGVNDRGCGGKQISALARQNKTPCQISFIFFISINPPF